MRGLISRRLRPLPGSGRSPPPARRTGDFDLNPPRPPRRRPLTPAAVLVPLVERGPELSVLLTRRTEHLNDHAGQISFPGGRMEPADSGPVATALRETREEIGLDARFIELSGCLDDYETVSGFLVTPVVGFVRSGFDLRPDGFEVADIFEVPLAFILDPGNHQTHSRTVRGRERRYHVFEYCEHYIWGATAGMLMNLYGRLHGEEER